MTTYLHRAVMGLAALLLSVFFVWGIGRAVDQQAAPYKNITRNGVTLQCAYITDITGRSFYDSCVPAKER